MSMHWVVLCGVARSGRLFYRAIVCCVLGDMWHGRRLRLGGLHNAQLSFLSLCLRYRDRCGCEGGIGVASKEAAEARQLHVSLAKQDQIRPLWR